MMSATRSLAEWGSVGLLERELQQQGPQLRSIVKAQGLWHPHLNGNTSATFSVDRSRHLLSLASMFGTYAFAPSYTCFLIHRNVERFDRLWSMPFSQRNPCLGPSDYDIEEHLLRDYRGLYLYLPVPW